MLPLLLACAAPALLTEPATAPPPLPPLPQDVDVVVVWTDAALAEPALVHLGIPQWPGVDQSTGGTGHCAARGCALQIEGPPADLTRAWPHLELESSSADRAVYARGQSPRVRVDVTPSGSVVGDRSALLHLASEPLQSPALPQIPQGSVVVVVVDLERGVARAGRRLARERAPWARRARLALEDAWAAWGAHLAGVDALVLGLDDDTLTVWLDCASPADAEQLALGARLAVVDARIGADERALPALLALQVRHVGDRVEVVLPTLSQVLP